MNIHKQVQFILERHRSIEQKRKYTGEDYEIHLAEVAAIAQLVYSDYKAEVPLHVFIFVAWAHDLLEDTATVIDELLEQLSEWSEEDRFLVKLGIETLTDVDDPNLNREQRLAINAEKIKNAPRWIQGLRLCDGYSNLKSITHHDPDFAKVYLREKEAMYSGFQNDHALAMSFLTPIMEKAAVTLKCLENCNQCGKGYMVERIKDIQYKRDGCIYSIPNIHGLHCTRCAHVKVSGWSVTSKISKLIKDVSLNNHIEAYISDSEELTK